MISAPRKDYFVSLPGDPFPDRLPLDVAAQCLALSLEAGGEMLPACGFRAWLVGLLAAMANQASKLGNVERW